MQAGGNTIPEVYNYPNSFPLNGIVQFYPIQFTNQTTNSIQYYYTFNSLSPSTTATSNVVSYTQNTLWGTGTFTANVYITDSAATDPTVSSKC